MSRIQARFEVVRGGVPVAELTAGPNDAASVSFSGDADIKLSFSGTFDEIPPQVNFLTDHLRPSLLIDGTEYPLGEYVITTPQAEKEGERVRWQLTGYDLTYLAQLSRLEERLHFSKDDPYRETIIALLGEAGIPRVELPQSDVKLATDREDWEPGTDRLTIVNTLLAEMNYRSLYMDLDGTVRARPWTAPSLQGVQHVYESGKDSVLLPSLSLGRDTFDLPNVFIREVENPDLDKTLRAVAENKDADSPISIQNRGFRVVDYEKVDNVASQEERTGMVQNLLVQSRFSNETVSYETGPQPTHGIWDVVLLRHGEDKGIYEETAWELTLDHSSTMSHEGRRALWL